MADYETFMDELDKVWRHCFRVLAMGGRLCCVVGDVCLARRHNKGRHMVVPLHADISVRCREIGFDYLTPIFWHKIANASYEVENGSSFLGKPYEPNAIIKNDVEYVLMLRKPGGYRKPTEEQRRLSKIGKEDHGRWFRSAWHDVPGASTKKHPAPFPRRNRQPPGTDILLRRRHGPGPVRRHGDDAGGGPDLAAQRHRGRDRPCLSSRGTRPVGERAGVLTIFRTAPHKPVKARSRKVPYSSGSPGCGAGGLRQSVAGGLVVAVNHHGSEGIEANGVRAGADGQAAKVAGE